MSTSPGAGSRPGDLPSVSVVLPTLNERKFVRDCLASLVAQDYPNVIEILVVDGGSDDGTTQIASAVSPLIRVVPNARVTAAAAMNAGIAAASGAVIVRADAHTVYARDYVRSCVAVLEESGAAVVGGPMCPVGLNRFGRAVAAVTASPLGVGPGRFHYSRAAHDVDTVYLGAYRPETVRSVGGYDDETLQWAAEDQELNLRIRDAGGRIRLDPRIRSSYFPRQEPRALWNQYWNYGVCKASTLKKHRRLPSLRPLAPAGLGAVGAAGLVAGVLSRRPVLAIAVPAGYAVGAIAAALRISGDPGVAPADAVLALGICHWSYALGFWAGVWRIVRGRPFDNRPTHHR